MKTLSIFLTFPLLCGAAFAAQSPLKVLPADGQYVARQGNETACAPLTSNPTDREFTFGPIPTQPFILVCQTTVRDGESGEMETGRFRCIDQSQPSGTSDLTGLGYAGRFTSNSITIESFANYTYAATTGVTTAVQNSTIKSVTFMLDTKGACP